MIATLIIWLYTFTLMFLYGQILLVALQRVFSFSIGEVRFPVVLLLGMTGLLSCSSVLNLFLPLNIVSAGILLAGGLAALLWRKSFVRIARPVLHPLSLVLLAAALVTVLNMATLHPSSSDTALYHAQTIRWFETYRVVPGLGNLHHRLAFNSAWLVLNAAFSFAFSGRSFHLMSSVLFACVLLYLVEGFEAIFQKQVNLSSVMKLLLLPLSFYLLASDISSPSTDMPATLFIWVILILWAEQYESGSKFDVRLIVIYILSLVAVTIKLSALPLLGFAGFILIDSLLKKQWKRAGALILVGSLILIPWFVRSAILSGYILFPASQLDLLPVDWKIPQAQARAVRNGITGFARSPGKDWSKSLDMPFREWTSMWFDDQTLNRKLVFLLALFSPLLLVGTWRMFPSFITSHYLFAYFLFYAAGVFWFFSAPDFRFGYGSLIALCVLVLSPFLLSLYIKANGHIQGVPQIILIALVGLQVYFLVSSLEVSTLRERLLLPADYFHSRAQACSIANGSVYCRIEGGQCNYDAFPCIPTPRPNVEMRGATLQDGFRVRP